MFADSQGKAHRLVEEVRQRGMEEIYPDCPRFAVGMGTCGRASGAEAVAEALVAEVDSRGLDAEVVPVGCNGMCWAEPLVSMYLPERGRALYGDVIADDVSALVQGALEGTFPEKKLVGVKYIDEVPSLGTAHGVVPDVFPNIDELPSLAFQNRRLLARCGIIAPCSVRHYAAFGGYFGIAKALDEMTPDQVLDEVSSAGLRGRGGAGFPTGKKWRAVAEAPGKVKYVIANGDEGDPGAFMDRALMEGDPHAIIEGMLIAAYAVGAKQGYVFTRGEYHLAVETLNKAIDEARKAGFLGADILGSSFTFDIAVVESPGAYVCGETTAMIRTMEGFPGRPVKRPPYAAQSGLWEKPTCVNNVETFANVPLIVTRGAQWYRKAGTGESPGTKLFSLAGFGSASGLVEVELGTPIEQLNSIVGADAGDAGAPAASTSPDVSVDASALLADAHPHAYQIGGPSGILIPADAGVTLDYETLSQKGGSIGSGGIVALGAHSCVVEVVRYLVGFSASQSCGQCPSCKRSLGRCAELLGEICEGKGTEETLDELVSEADKSEKHSLCGLGRMATRPIRSSLSYFADEFRAHLKGTCPGRVCKELISFSVIEKNCPGCRCCKPSCPSNAIRGRYGKPFHIDTRLCVRCWMCTVTCPYHAIAVRTGP